MRACPLIIVSMLAAAGCAKSPDQISAVTIDDRTYQGLSCSQLSTEQLRNAQLLQALSADQRSAQSGDALGVFLLGLPISSMSGADKAAPG